MFSAICLFSALPKAAVAQGEALTHLSDNPRICEGAGLTPCDIVLPEDDIALTLIPGYGITEPHISLMPDGAAADRPSFDIVRNSDGAVVMMINARQANAPYCQNGLAGDRICVTDEMTDADGLALAFVLGSLNSAAGALDMRSMILDEPGTVPGDAQGVWFADIDNPAAPEHETTFMMVELYQDEGDNAVFGQFVTAPDIGPLRATSGNVTGRLLDDSLTLELAAADGTPLLLFEGTGDGNYSGAVTLAGGIGDPVGTTLSRVAGTGENWTGPQWMTGQSGDAAAADQAEQRALGDISGELEADDGDVLDMMSALMGAVTGTTSKPLHAQSTPSPTLLPLDAKTVDLQGIPTDALIDMIIPFQVVRR